MLKNILKLVTAVLILALITGCEETAEKEQSNSQNFNDEETAMVKFETTKGDILIELYPEKAPKSVDNFLAYVRNDFYDGTIFHRIIPGFVVQGGGFNTEFEKKPTMDPIVNEADNGLKNERGTLSMARTNDPDSATSQFFINLVDNDSLNPIPGRSAGYAVFGKVVEGMDVVDEMANVPTETRGRYADVPAENIVIINAVIKEE
jgi:cyclophilin family peptidyl-prolyl cis-trans isomerase